MPTYKYKCPECDNEFEAFHWITSEETVGCPECGCSWKAHTNKLMTPTQGYKFKNRVGLTHRPAGGSIEKVT